ncbi:MAG: hypothetical protein EOO77_47155 [Oxalobacteraceae bacterium]|nr:MAG: hypothetical protein EOO77_47155 [Oxalobacteraceae bacterium]
MADQTIRVESMPDDSDMRVAFDLYTRLSYSLPEKRGLDAIEQELRLFAACRKTVRTGDVVMDKLR